MEDFLSPSSEHVQMRGFLDLLTLLSELTSAYVYQLLSVLSALFAFFAWRAAKTPKLEEFESAFFAELNAYIEHFALYSELNLEGRGKHHTIECNTRLGIPQITEFHMMKGVKRSQKLKYVLKRTFGGRLEGVVQIPVRIEVIGGLQEVEEVAKKAGEDLGAKLLNGRESIVTRVIDIKESASRTAHSVIEELEVVHDDYIKKLEGCAREAGFEVKTRLHKMRV